MTPSPSRCFGGEGECKGGLSGSDKGFPLGGYAHGSSLPPMQLHNSRRRAPAQKPGHRARPPSSPLEPGLGVLLLDFFRLYGRVINMKEVRAVHMRGWRGYAWGEGLPLPAPTHRGGVSRVINYPSPTLPRSASPPPGAATTSSKNNKAPPPPHFSGRHLCHRGRPLLSQAR